MSAFTPKTGDLFARDGNDGIWALVITPDRPVKSGYMVCAVLWYPNGKISAPRRIILKSTDRHICREVPLPENGKLIFARSQERNQTAHEDDRLSPFQQRIAQRLAELRQQQREFQAKFIGVPVSDITDEDHAEAARLMTSLPKMTFPKKGW